MSKDVNADIRKAVMDAKNINEPKTFIIDESQIAHAKIVRTCILCGEGTNSIHDHLCERCKKALLAMIKYVEENNDTI